MINGIELLNFQSHGETYLELHPGVNAIVGPSDNGKSAILRGLFWARYNQPSGDAYVSKWARNEKGKQDDQTMVTIVKGKRELFRGKGPELNGYNLDGKEFTALGKGGIPEQVIPFFNTTEVNIQTQMDSPFLIGDTPSEKARFLNSVVDMSEIDLYLSSVESKKRFTTKEIKLISQEVDSLKKEEGKYSSLNQTVLLLSRVEKVNNRIIFKKADRDSLETSIGNYTRFNSGLSLWDSIETIEGLFSSLEKTRKEREEKKDKAEILNNELDRYKHQYRIFKKTLKIGTADTQLNILFQVNANRNKILKKVKTLEKNIQLYTKYEKILSKTPDTKKLESLLSKLEKVRLETIKKEELFDSLSEINDRYIGATEKMKKMSKRLLELKSTLPETCPTCNQPFPKEVL